MIFADDDITAVCLGCGNIFIAKTQNQLRCSQHCGRSTESKDGARKSKSDLHDVKFVAIDGEGLSHYKYELEYNEETGEEEMRRSETEEIQDYILLGVGDQHLDKGGKPLTHLDVFPFLWEQFEKEENKGAAFIGFALGYDFTMWLKSLHADRAYELLHKDGIKNRQPKSSMNPAPFPVRDGGKEITDEGTVYSARRWEFDILGMKRFRLRPYVRPEDVPTHIVQHKDGTMSVVKDNRPWMFICDVFSFFQTSFKAAIDPAKWGDHPVVSADEWEIINNGKDHRGAHECELGKDCPGIFGSKMIEYNQMENMILARMMTVINKGFVSIGVKLQSKNWMGPGQAAQAWLRNIEAPTSKIINGYIDPDTGDVIPGCVPDFVSLAARNCYYGGWFEIFNHGPVPGTSYEYDINSAYPYIIAHLPCLLHGDWKRGTGKMKPLAKNGLRMVLVTVEGRDDWVGPLPYREADKSIKRPLNVRGWYWWHEVQASKTAGLIHKVTVHEWIQFRPHCDCPPPMAAIKDLYELRLQVGKNTPQGIGIKLVINSAYGKLAQSIGSPTFANSVYASLITCGCRVMILEAIAAHPTGTEALLMVATDGVYFKTPIPETAIEIDPKKLGAWDMGTKENLSLLMPGVYWDDKARAQIKKGETPALKSRGVSGKNLAQIIDKVDEGWKKFGYDEKTGAINPAPKVSINIPWGLIGAKEAVHRNNWDLCGKNMYNITRWLDGDPSKKRWDALIEMHGGLRSRPYKRGDDGNIQTLYYLPSFGDERVIADEDMLLTPDGTAGSLRREAFGLGG